MKNSPKQLGDEKNWQAETLPILQEIRRLIRLSGLSQRAVEQSAGFSRGYLSQLLGRNLDLKVRHILAILGALDMPPGRFFARVYSRSESRGESGKPPSLFRFEELCEPISEDLDHRLDNLYRDHEESLNRLRRRLNRCEGALAQLAERGLLHLESTTDRSSLTSTEEIARPKAEER